MLSDLSDSIVQQLYDQQLYTKKTLMPRHAMRPLDVGLNGEGSTEEPDEIDYQFIDSAPFDIILCEFCDAELYSEQAYRVCLSIDLFRTNLGPTDFVGYLFICIFNLYNVLVISRYLF